MSQPGAPHFGPHARMRPQHRVGWQSPPADPPPAAGRIHRPVPAGILSRVRSISAGAWVVGVISAGSASIFLALLATIFLFDWHYVAVGGSSMEPTIRYGSLAVMKPVKPSSLREGNIVEFRAPGTGRITTHRIVSIAPDGQAFIAKGDNSPVVDEAPVPMSSVHAKYLFSIPYLGSVNRWLHSPIGLRITVIVPILAMVAIQAAPRLRRVVAR